MIPHIPTVTRTELVVAPLASTVPPASTTARLFEQSYSQQVRQAVARQRCDPPLARRRGINGTVLLGFRFSSDGSIGVRRVLRSSGSEVLDRSALSSLLKVRRFAPLPVEIAKRTWDIEVPMVFGCVTASRSVLAWHIIRNYPPGFTRLSPPVSVR